MTKKKSVKEKVEELGKTNVVVPVVEIPGEERGVHHLKHAYGNYKPQFKDGVARFRDVYQVKGETQLQQNGLWKRYTIYAYNGDKLKKGWEGTGEVFVDDLGECIMLENGIKLYSFPKKVDE